VLREDDLHHALVHADRRGQHAAADVGQVGELEQALHRAVLAVGAVQHRKDDVEAQPRHERLAAALLLDRRRAAIDRQDGDSGIKGALIGSVIVGLIDNFGKALVPELSYFTLFAPMVIMLAVKPTGLYGRA